MAKIDIQKEDVLAGLSAVISINVNEPNFDSQAKVKLSGKEVEDAVYSALVKELNKFVNNLSEEEKKIISTKIVNNAKIRQAADVAKIAKKKSVRNASPANLPSNLKDCSWAGGENSDLCELYICEGLSAAGSVVAARNANFQAVLPIRGKILNVMKLDLTKKNQRERFNNNAEINDIIKALNTGVGEHCDIDKARYGKVVFTCFSGDTEVFMLDGTVKTFEELVEMEKENPDQDYWVYSTTLDGQLVPGRARHPRVTSYTNVIAHVILDNGEEIKCTPDHLFLNRDGEYVEAKDLTPGTSLMPMYFKTCDKVNHNLGRQMYYDNLEDKWEFTHKTVSDYFSPYKGKGWSRHHIDGNFLNNNPDNLVQLETGKHHRLHASELMTKYNKSDAHRAVASKIGKLYGKENMTKYNKSDEHRAKAAEIGKIYGPITLTEYNKSEKHKDTVKNMNKDENIKFLQMKGRIESVISFMIVNGYDISESGYNKLKEKYSILEPRDFNDALSHFNSLEEMIELSKKHAPCNPQLIGSRKVPFDKTIKSKSSRLINQLKLDGKEINEENYNSIKKRPDPRWQSIIDVFGNIENAIEYSETSNHMVKEVWFEDCPLTPMYDFTVEKYHNFVDKAGEDSGVVVHQCDSDVDGKNINVLLLGVFYRLFRPLIEAGMVYQCTSPFFEVKYRQNGSEKTEYAMDEKERMEIESRLKSNNIKYTLARAKGLGELNADVFHDVTMNPKNRTLIRITMKDAKAADDMLELAIGNMPADARKDWMNNHTDVIDDLGLYS